MAELQHQALYKDLASYYDKVYHFKDYKKESQKLVKVISKYRKSKGKELLEVACGTGSHLKYLRKKFKSTGMDLNPEMIQLAKQKLKGVDLIEGDMIDFKLKKSYDVILCLFSSIGYVRTKQNLLKTLKNFAGHLKPGGVAVIEPWLDKKTYRKGAPHITVYQDRDLIVARATVSLVTGKNISRMDMNYLVAERNKGVRHFVDRHEMGMFEKKETLDAMERAGLKAKFLKTGLLKDRGLYIGVKPGESDSGRT